MISGWYKVLLDGKVQMVRYFWDEYEYRDLYWYEVILDYFGLL